MIIAILCLLILSCDDEFELEVDSVPDLDIKSSAFEQNGMIPSKYTADGEDVNPDLSIQGIPDTAKSLALICDDPDAPGGDWVHWVVANIPVTERIAEDSVPGTEGKNDFGKTSYGGPAPPSGTHRYFFKVYALDEELNLSAGFGKSDLLKAMDGHLLAYGELLGKYSRR
jgi:hypothetical protein